MRSFEKHLTEFNTRRVRLVAISVDSPDVVRTHCQKEGYTYTFLSDPKGEATARYDLVHTDGGPGGADISRPAEFLLDSRGRIRWVNLTDDVRVRARPERVLKVIDELRLGAGG